MPGDERWAGWQRRVGCDGTCRGARDGSGRLCGVGGAVFGGEEPVRGREAVSGEATRYPGAEVCSGGQGIPADAEAVLEGQGAERVREYGSGVGEILGARAGVAGRAGLAAVVRHWRESGKA